MGALALLYFVALIVATIAAVISPTSKALPIAVVMWVVYLAVCAYPFLRHVVMRFLEAVVR